MPQNFSRNNRIETGFGRLQSSGKPFGIIFERNEEENIIECSIDGFLNFLAFNNYSASELRKKVNRVKGKLPRNRSFHFNRDDFENLARDYVNTQILSYHKKTFPRVKQMIKEAPFSKSNDLTPGKLVLPDKELYEVVLTNLLRMYTKRCMNSLISELMNKGYILLIQGWNEYQIQPDFVNSFIEKMNKQK